MELGIGRFDRNTAAGLRIDASKMERHCSIKGSGKVPLAILYLPVQAIAKMVDPRTDFIVTTTYFFFVVGCVFYFFTSRA